MAALPVVAGFPAGGLAGRARGLVGADARSRCVAVRAGRMAGVVWMARPRQRRAAAPVRDVRSESRRQPAGAGRPRSRTRLDRRRRCRLAAPRGVADQPRRLLSRGARPPSLRELGVLSRRQRHQPSDEPALVERTEGHGSRRRGDAGAAADQRAVRMDLVRRRPHHPDRRAHRGTLRERLRPGADAQRLWHLPDVAPPVTERALPLRLELSHRGLLHAGKRRRLHDCRAAQRSPPARLRPARPTRGLGVHLPAQPAHDLHRDREYDRAREPRPRLADHPAPARHRHRPHALAVSRSCHLPEC